MFSRQCPAHDRQLLRLLLPARCDELERRLALIEGELFLAAPDHRQPFARQDQLRPHLRTAVGPEATEDLLPQFHHLTIAFREGAALAGAFQAVLRMERRITRDGSLGQRRSL